MRVFPSVECDETSHIIAGTYSKCIMIPFISDDFDLMRVLCSCPMNKKKKIEQKGLCKGTMNTMYLFGSVVEILLVLQQKYCTIKTKKETKLC